ncbi:hypothetical protein ACFVAV_01570 [Nocardia sp. NPDC057663]|uniref:hypothetical protein n=1 Tax=Nocardia sp. NPDC057663 TaxID=3346201 RepID=UPI0036731C1A
MAIGVPIWLWTGQERTAGGIDAGRREMIAMPLGRAKAANFAQSLYEEVFYLDELGRTQKAVTLRTDPMLRAALRVRAPSGTN